MTPEQEALVLAHDAMAQRFAAAFRRYLPPHVDRDDLVQAGRLGLCAAALRWRPETGVPFEAYATIRVRGAVLDWLRDNRQVSTYTETVEGQRRDRRQAQVVQLAAAFDVATAPPDYDRAILIAQLLARLDAGDRREAFTVRAHLAGQTMRAIGAALGKCQTRASQFYMAATQRLRRDIAA